MNCLVVDDDPMSRKIIAQMIKETGLLTIKESFSSSSEAFHYLDEKSADLIFLDIEMPDMTGLEMLRNLPDHPLIIFTTANKEYALEAYDHRTVDYLVKPLEYPRFLKAVLKARDILNTTSEKTVQKWDFVLLKSEGVFIKIFYKDIIFIEATGDYIYINTATKKIPIHVTLKTFASKLPNEFIRVHRTYIINTNYLQTLEDNTISVNGYLIPVGVSYRSEVYSRLPLQ
jgi:two-component system, LytTR family, response regulator